MFPETLFPVSVLVSKMQFTAGKFDENPSMRAFAKILRAIRAKVKFCELVQIEWDHSIPLKLVCCGMMKEYRVQIGSLGIFTFVQSSIFVQRVARQSFDNNKENSVTLAGFKQQESTLQTHCISEPFLLFSFQSSVTLLSITEEFHCC